MSSQPQNNEDVAVDVIDLSEILEEYQQITIQNNAWFNIYGPISDDNERINAFITHALDLHHQIATLTNDFKDVTRNEQLSMFKSQFNNNEYNVTFYINTDGGDAAVLVYLLYSIARLRADFKKIGIKFTLTTINTFYAASGGALLFLIGDKRISTEASIFLFHKVQVMGQQYGSLTKVLRFLNDMHKMYEWIEEIPLKYLSKDSKLLSLYNNGDDVVIDARTAKKLGIVTDMFEINKNLMSRRRRYKRR